MQNAHGCSCCISRRRYLGLLSAAAFGIGMGVMPRTPGMQGDPGPDEFVDSRSLRPRPDVRIGLSDPGGSGLYGYYANGEIKVEGSSISEGIGNSRITANMAEAPIDVAYRIEDAEALPRVYQMLLEEGLCLGGSSGINVAGAMRMARDLGPGHTVVTILCDSGLRYQQRLFNAEFLESKGLEVPDFLRR